MALGIGAPQQMQMGKKPFEEEEEEPEGRTFDDIVGTRQAIFDNVLKAVNERPPVENERYALRIANAKWANTKPYTLAEQKRAIMARQSLGYKLKGDWELVDKATGDVVDRKSSTLAQVPYQTDRATFISNGREYSLSNQFRLKSGIYARKKADGELESHINLLPGTGRSFRVRMNPASGKFFADVGQSAVPLYPLLKSMGVSDDILEKRWGKDLLNSNRTREERDHVEVTKAYERLIGGNDPKEQHAEKLREYVNKMKVDPDIARASIGKYMDTPEDAEFAMSPEVLAATAQKLIAINRGEDEADDRDSLANQELMGPEEMFAERISKDSGKLMRQILWKSTPGNKLAGVPSGAFTPQMEAVLMNSGLGSPLEEINPMEALDHQLRVSRMGTGGIATTDAIPSEARGVQPTYLGFVDPFRTTECYSADTEVLVTVGKKQQWLTWDKVTKETELYTMKDGELIHEKPLDLMSYSFSGLLRAYIDDTVAFGVTPQHRMWVSRDEFGLLHYDLIDDVFGTAMWVELATGERYQLDPDKFSYEQYDGQVYCATMSTGLLIVRRVGRKGFVCGNSEKIGVDSRLAFGLRKGKDGQIYRKMVTNEGKSKWVSARDASRSIVAFPGEMESDEPYVRAMVKGKLGYVPREEVNYGVAAPDDMDDLGVNLIPFSNMTQGNRLVMAGKMMLQGMSLQNREAPLVMNRASGSEDTYEGLVGGKLGALRSKQGGVVTQLTPQGAVIEAPDGTKEEIEFHDNFPLNRKSYYYNKPLVELGQRVEPGQLVAGSNYTDDKGNLALGSHLRVALMPYKGLAHEDAYVMSESAAKRMTHEAMYTSDFEKTEGIDTGREKYLSNFPSVFDKEQIKKLDKGGVVRPGMRVNKGDPLVLAVGQPPKAGEGQREVHRNSGVLDKTITWDHDYEGEVTDAFVDEKGNARIAVRAAVPLNTGDKISGLFGDKGVVTKIIPDHMMPSDADGNPVDLIQNPLTIPTRKNPAQVYAMLLSKVAQKTGNPYLLDKFSKEDIGEMVRNELRTNGFNEDGTEELFDPETGRSLKQVMTGAKYTMKLHHTAESKAGARDFGGYDTSGTPQRGGGDGAKSMSGLGLNAMLSHNAFANIRDMKENKATRNDEFWRAFQLGQTPPMPELPTVYKKAMAHIQGAGINLKRKGDYTHLMAMRDADVDKLSGDRVISKPETIDDRTMQPVPGGLFDRSLVGGVGGERWARIDLPEPMPSPVMEDAIKTVLGLTGKEFDSYVSGQTKFNNMSGGKALQAALANINIDNEIAQAKNVIRTGSRTARDKAVKKLRVLQTAKDQDIHPKDWMMTKVPVLPPAFRPISKMTSGTSIISDPNYLYQDLMYNNEALSDAAKELGEEGSTEERLNAYKSLKAVVGLGDPVHPKLQEKGVAGLLKHVFGKGSPKFGMYQRKVVGMNVDMSGRAVIGVDPEFDMDEVGLPEHQAWKMYRPFLVRRMVKNGMPATRALQEIEKQTDKARDMLVEEMNNRPVLTTRAPALHRYNIMAARPRLVKGKAMIMSPLVLSGYTADIDGDAMSMHVPVSDDAVKEAYEKMLPSKHLLNASEFKVHYLPSQEYQLGLYQATQKAKKGGKTHYFKSKEEAVKAYRRGEIGVTDQVVIP